MLEATRRLAAAVTEKRCCECHTIKPLTEFYPRNKNGNGGLPATPLGAVYARCKKCCNRNRVRDRWRMQNGMSHADYIGMVVDQCGTCAACGETETAVARTRKTGDRRGIRRLNIDHDHVTGRIRGLLCSRCNMTLGLVRDDPVLLRRIIAYLEEC